MIVATALVALAGALLLVVLVDGLDAAGRFGRIDGNYPVWFQLFQEGSFIEWVQSAALMIGIFVAGRGVERARAVGDRALTSLFALLGLSCALLLLEDSGNVGERIAAWAGEAFGDGSALAEYGRVPVLLVVGAVPLYAIVRHRAVLRRFPKAAWYLLGGIGCYALAGGTGELLNAVVPFYDVVGGLVLDDIAGGRLDPGVDLWSDPGIVFMDYVYEESLELAATALLAGGVLALSQAVDRPAPVLDLRDGTPSDRTGERLAGARR